MSILTRDALNQAQELVYRHLKPTPAYAWPGLCEALGCEVWVKHENHTPIGAFKVRGGLTYVDELARHGTDTEIVTATRGNHGQSIPYAARLHGIGVHVYVPEGNSREKNAAMVGWGAELHVHGRDFDEAREAAEAHAAERGGHLVPSFHPQLVRGVATYGAELFAAVKNLDTVYVPIGMGSGAASLVLVRDLLGLSAEIVGVVAAGADAFACSFEQGRIVPGNRAHTFADGMATRVPHAEAFDILSRGLSRVVRVQDDEVAAAVRLLYRTTHNVAEGAGAAPTAALMKEAEQQAGRRVAVILTGGNIDQQWFADILLGNTPVPA